MKVIIAGSRTFRDLDILTKECDFYLQNCKDIEVVSGTAAGADSLGEMYALTRNYKVTRFPADWQKYGKAAGYIRNEEMAKYADALIAFWDGISKGTEHMINLAKRYNLKIAVYEHTNTDNGRTPGAGFSSKGYDPTQEVIWPEHGGFRRRKGGDEAGEGNGT
jgi:hypothetical protein